MLFVIAIIIPLTMPQLSSLLRGGLWADLVLFLLALCCFRVFQGRCISYAILNLEYKALSYMVTTLPHNGIVALDQPAAFPPRSRPFYFWALQNHGMYSLYPPRFHLYVFLEEQYVHWRKSVVVLHCALGR